MNVVVFCGPTIGAEEVRQVLPTALLLPPAKRGDLLNAALSGAQIILLVDGYFDRVQSTWHKEILWALSQGIHVCGASSMGALRAAELASFGMVGVGKIFEAFRDGELEDDDEVAVAHADEEHDYRALSEAMVNIRATLQHARRQGVISAETEAELIARGKSLMFYERSLRALTNGSYAEPVQREAGALRDWLLRGRVDQKRADALAALQVVAALARSGRRARPASFTLAETDGWRELLREVQQDVGSKVDRGVRHRIREELSVSGALGSTLQAAMFRWLAAERLAGSGARLNNRAVEEAIDGFRRDRELLSAESFEAWIDAAELDEPALEQFMRREAVARVTREELASHVGGAVDDELRARGVWRALSERAADKEALLANLGSTLPTLEQVGLTEDGLWQWFFGERLGRAWPASVAAYAAREGTTVDELFRYALRELVFTRARAAKAED